MQTMNKDIAKLIRAVSHHKVMKSIIGTKFLQVPSMIVFIWDGAVPKRWPRGAYYIPIQQGTRLDDVVNWVDASRLERDAAQQKLKDAETEHKEWLRVLNNIVTGNVKETLVVQIFTKRRIEKLENSTFWNGLLMHNDKLERLGIRRISDEMCTYVALITINGVYDPKRLEYVEHGITRQALNHGSAEHVGEIKRLHETVFSLNELKFESEMEIPIL